MKSAESSKARRRPAHTARVHSYKTLSLVEVLHDQRGLVGYIVMSPGGDWLGLTPSLRRAKQVANYALKQG